MNGGSCPSELRLRLTLTLPVLNHAEHIYFLVAGSEKAESLRQGHREITAE